MRNRDDFLTLSMFGSQPGGVPCRLQHQFDAVQEHGFAIHVHDFARSWPTVEVEAFAEVLCEQVTAESFL